MTASRRLRILEALKARVEAITIANGFTTDAGLHVYLGVIPALGADDEKQAIALIPGEDSVGKHLSNIRIDLPVNIAAVADPTLDRPWEAVEAMLLDIKKAVELDDRSLGGLLIEGNGVLGLYRGTTEILERRSGTDAVGVAITYGCPYVEAFGAPEA